MRRTARPLKGTVATSISDTFIGPSLAPSGGSLVVDIVAANGDVLARPFDVSELRQIPTENDTVPRSASEPTGSQDGRWPSSSPHPALTPPPGCVPPAADRRATRPTRIARGYRSDRRWGSADLDCRVSVGSVACGGQRRTPTSSPSRPSRTTRSPSGSSRGTVSRPCRRARHRPTERSTPGS
jgi:hypothetical protein